jgi:predicted TIM-barrel fold metal-dependent hydrolase
LKPIEKLISSCGSMLAMAYEPWAAGISEISKRPHVAVKISGISAYADADTWDVNDLHPSLEYCIASFGWDRAVWGSDWPVATLGSSLSLGVSATSALIAGASLDEKAKLFS